MRLDVVFLDASCLDRVPDALDKKMMNLFLTLLFTLFASMNLSLGSAQVPVSKAQVSVSVAQTERERIDLQAKARFLTLNFFRDGSGMHLVPGLTAFEMSSLQGIL